MDLIRMRQAGKYMQTHIWQEVYPTRSHTVVGK